jgi:acyl-CoA thioesterase I
MLHHRFTLPTTLLALAGCAGDAVAPWSPPTQAPHWVLVATGPGAVAALPGSEAPAPTVTVTDVNGYLAPNIAVRFTVEDGGGSIAVTEVVADSFGVATAGRWQLGAALGVQRVRAEVADEPAATTDFVTTAIPAQGPLRSDARCAMPDSLFPAGWTLPRTAERLARRQPLTVVAIGSSSTVGVGATVPDSTYPALLARHLRALYPASDITVYNAGRGAQQLDQLQARFAADVGSREPQLVVLQTGTVDAINGVAPQAFEARLRDAVTALGDLGAEVVLLDSQRYPGFGEGTSYRAFQAAMRRVANERGLPLVRRYDLMSHWVERGIYTYPQILGTDAFHPGDLTYSCTGRYLAEGFAGAVRRWTGR